MIAVLLATGTLLAICAFSKGCVISMEAIKKNS